jgi:hypothetical protein
MPEPTLAYIIPLSGGLGGAHPEHPIAPGGPPPWVSHPIPPGVWPNPPVGSPPGIWPSPGHPSHPIYIPPDSGGVVTPPIYYPPGIWGGGNATFPTPPIYYPPGEPPVEGGGDEHPAHPIVLPVPPTPAHPIVIPPGIWGGGNETFPTPPIVIVPPGVWGGGNEPFPTPPIVLPPPVPPSEGHVSDQPVPVLFVFVPGHGWVVFNPAEGGWSQPPTVEHHDTPPPK